MNCLKASLLFAFLLSTITHASENMDTQDRSEQLKKIVPPEDYVRYVPTDQSTSKEHAELFGVLVVDYKVSYREANQIARSMIDIKSYVPEQNFLYSDTNLHALLNETHEWLYVQGIFVNLRKEKMDFETSVKVTLKLCEVCDANKGIEPRTFLKFDDERIRNMAFNADALKVLDKYATLSKADKLSFETAALRALGVIKGAD